MRNGTQTSRDLEERLRSIDHRGYPAYKSLQGSYDFGDYVLGIDHVQGDPFAAPSALHVWIPAASAGFPNDVLSDPARPLTCRNSIAIADYLLGGFHAALHDASGQVRGSGKSGTLSCTAPGEEVLERTACGFDADGNLTARFLVGFPAAGRKILASELDTILFGILPSCVRDNLLYRSLPARELREVANLAEDQVSLRQQMAEQGLIAFVADGAILPRESGVSQRPMFGATPFRSPEEDRVTLTLPHAGQVTGMGIRPGITLIIGGGYHGKSTLLEALERGVYDHIATDGRELVMADPTTTKIRAEDGRSIADVDISPFIANLPSGKDTRHFTSQNASGSTSQAASVIEAVEAGARVLLMDEDTCATNFMVRDELMAQVVAERDEPIQPYSRKMRALYRECGVSTILVAGSSGAFFPEADRVIQLDRYQPRDVTNRVREVLAKRGVTPSDSSFPALDPSSRRLRANRRVLASPRGHVKRRNLGRDGFELNHQAVDLRAVSQIVDPEQTELLAILTEELTRRLDGTRPLREAVGDLMERLQAEGFGAVCDHNLPGNLAMVRPQEVFCAINRCRWIA